MTSANIETPLPHEQSYIDLYEKAPNEEAVAKLLWDRLHGGRGPQLDPRTDEEPDWILYFVYRQLDKDGQALMRGAAWKLLTEKLNEENLPQNDEGRTPDGIAWLCEWLELNCGERSANPTPDLEDNQAYRDRLASLFFHSNGEITPLAGKWNSLKASDGSGVLVNVLRPIVVFSNKDSLKNNWLAILQNEEFHESSYVAFQGLFRLDPKAALDAVPDFINLQYKYSDKPDKVRLVTNALIMLHESKAGPLDLESTSFSDLFKKIPSHLRDNFIKEVKNGINGVEKQRSIHG